MKSSLVALTIVAAFSGAYPATAQAAGDPVKGKSVFARCAACHAVEAGKNRVGPSLAGVVGRKAASVPGYVYSPALKSSGLVWNQATLDRYLLNPRAMVPGTKMIFAGLPKPSDRADVITYIGNPGSK